jgi:L-serine dehydratase, iron-sulfur-dependent, beta subunit
MGKNFSAFDILGPVMIGPSSSHTAGAAKLGRIAASIAGRGIRKTTFILHGSFARTYKGHGTDKALLAGVLGMEPQDERLRDSFSIASQEGMEFEFIEGNLGDVHPNTVKFLFSMEDGREVSVRGSSIGGGSIVINEVDGEEVEFTGTFPTIITKHIDRPGIITAVTSALSNVDVNIAFMKVFRRSRGQTASMVVETDNLIPPEALNYISQIKGIQKVMMINPV